MRVLRSNAAMPWMKGCSGVRFLSQRVLEPWGRCPTAADGRPGSRNNWRDSWLSSFCPNRLLGSGREFAACGRRAYAAACGMASICDLLTHRSAVLPPRLPTHGMGAASSRRVRRCRSVCCATAGSASLPSIGALSLAGARHRRGCGSVARPVRRSWAPPRSRQSRRAPQDSAASRRSGVTRSAEPIVAVRGNPIWTRRMASSTRWTPAARSATRVGPHRWLRPAARRDRIAAPANGRARSCSEAPVQIRRRATTEVRRRRPDCAAEGRRAIHRLAVRRLGGWTRRARSSTASAELRPAVSDSIDRYAAR